MLACARLLICSAETGRMAKGKKQKQNKKTLRASVLHVWYLRRVDSTTEGHLGTEYYELLETCLRTTTAALLVGYCREYLASSSL